MLASRNQDPVEPAEAGNKPRIRIPAYAGMTGAADGARVRGGSAPAGFGTAWATPVL